MWIKRADYLALYGLNATLAARVTFLEGAAEGLRARVKELSDRLDAERLRSDEAVDQMLRVKGLPPVTPPARPPMLDLSIFEEDPAEVKEIVHAIKERGGAEVLLGDN